MLDILRGAAPPPAPRFPAIKEWQQDTIYYEGSFVAFAGSCYQARCDSARPPGSNDWICISHAGMSFNVRGAFDPTPEIAYRAFDVVMHNGSAWVAIEDHPGECPGPSWKLIASAGKRGSPGRRGEPGSVGPKGERGEPGLSPPRIRAWHIDRERFLAIPLMSDGTRGPPLELRSLFEEFQQQTEAAE